jgi:hypothetical protein
MRELTGRAMIFSMFFRRVQQGCNQLLDKDQTRARDLEVDLAG